MSDYKSVDVLPRAIAQNSRKFKPIPGDGCWSVGGGGEMRGGADDFLVSLRIL